MNYPEIRSLEAVIVLSEELNFSRAARRLHIEQSSVSRRISDFEARSGLCLFVRNKQNVEVTEAGRQFVQEARYALLHAERAMLNASAASRGADTVLNLGQSAYVDPYIVSAMLSIQLPLFPRLKIKHWSAYSHELARQVALGKLDAALVVAVPATPELSFLSVAVMPIFIALQLNNPGSQQRDLRLEHLADADWILPAPQVNPHLHEMIQNARSSRGIKMPVVHYVTTPEEAFVLIHAHNGVAFMTRSCAWQIARDGVTMRPLAEDSLRLETMLVTNVENKSRLVNEFVRAAGRKLLGNRTPQQGRLPMAC